MRGLVLLPLVGYNMDLVGMVCVAVGIVGVAWLIDYHLDLDGSYGKEDENT